MSFFLIRWIKNIAKKAGDGLAKLFSNAEAAWKKLSPQVQDSLVKASGIVAAINDKVDMLPVELYATLQKEFGFDKAKLDALLDEVAKGINLGMSLNDDNAIELLQNIQQYLKDKEGKFWANASDTIARLVAIFLAPKSTKFAVIASFITFAYHRFVKKDQ
jgi:hypothetical protein